MRTILILAMCLLTQLTFAQEKKSIYVEIADLYTRLKEQSQNLYFDEEYLKLDVLNMVEPGIIEEIKTLVRQNKMKLCELDFSLLPTYLSKGKVSVKDFNKCTNEVVKLKKEDLQYSTKIDSFYSTYSRLMIGPKEPFDSVQQIEGMIKRSSFDVGLSRRRFEARCKLLRIGSVYECSGFYLIVYELFYSITEQKFGVELILK